MPNKKSIAIIVVNWKKYDLTFECIDSVLASSFVNFKIILIDNEFKKIPKALNSSECFFKR